MSKNFFQSAFDRLVSARERQARLYVNGMLLQMDDASLKAIGRSRESIRREGSQTKFI